MTNLEIARILDFGRLGTKSAWERNMACDTLESYEPSFSGRFEGDELPTVVGELLDEITWSDSPPSRVTPAPPPHPFRRLAPQTVRVRAEGKDVRPQRFIATRIMPEVRVLVRAPTPRAEGVWTWIAACRRRGFVLGRRASALMLLGFLFGLGVVLRLLFGPL